MIKPYRAVAVAIALGFPTVWMLPTAAMADVTVTRATQFGGIMGMGASKSTSVEYIKGDEKRDDRTMKFTGSILSKFGGTRTSVTIYRVDKNRIFTLNTARHTYTALPMTASNAQATSGTQSGAGDKSQQHGNDSHQNHTKVIRNELTVKATGKRNTINGYRCKEYLMTWLVVTEDTRTKQRSKSVMTSDIWATSETRELHTLKTDELAYSHAYLKRLGLEISPQQQQQFGLNMLGLMSGRSQRDLKRAMSKIHGYPISISVKWQSNAQNNDSGDNGEAALAHVAGNLGGLLSGVLHQDENNAKPTTGNMQTIFSSTTELVKVNTAAIPSRTFEIPTGYHKTSY